MITFTYACAIACICMLAAKDTGGIIAICVLYGFFSGACKSAFLQLVSLFPFLLDAFRRFYDWSLIHEFV
jgi:hypothetical protein